MNAREADVIRRRQGRRWAGTAPNRKKIEAATGLSSSHNHRLCHGEHAIDYVHLVALARDPMACPEAVLAGARAEIERARITGDVPTLADALYRAVVEHQREDGAEDNSQLPVTDVALSLAWHDTMTLPNRRAAAAALNAWADDLDRLLDHTHRAQAVARVLAEKLEGA